MSQSLLVVMGDAIAGTLTRMTGGRLRFDYDDDYRRGPDATPLSVSMPLEVRSHADRAITPWLWGLLPDNEAVLARWSREFHVSISTPFSLLATPVGRDCAGAVRFSTEEEVDLALKRTGHVEWLDDKQVAAKLRELKEDSTSWLGRTFTGQFSLAGAQAKTALLYREGRWGVPSGSTPTSHILKPAVTSFDDHDLNEHLCLDAARRLGMTVAKTRVARFDDQTAIVVERYDRLTRGGRLTRIHQEDLCQALGVPPSKKYQNEGGPSAKDIVTLFRQVMPAEAADDATRRLVDALAWNWLIAGTDAHAKNYSLLLATDQVRLAPIYDVASALPYRAHEKKLRLAMKIGDDYQVYPRRNPWPRAAADLGLDPATTVDRVRELAMRAPQAFADASNSPEVAALKRPLAERLVELIADRAMLCRDVLGNPT